MHRTQNFKFEFRFSILKVPLQPLQGSSRELFRPLRSLQAETDKASLDRLSCSHGEIGEKGLSQNAMKSP